LEGGLKTAGAQTKGGVFTIVKVPGQRYSADLSTISENKFHDTRQGEIVRFGSIDRPLRAGLEIV
jgi:hypothetical protein